MIRHIVLFRFSEEAAGRSKAENVALTREKLDALPAVIPQILASRTAVGAEGSAPANADLLLVSDFADRAALETYLAHPAHKAVGAFMRPLREWRQAIDVEIEK